MEELKHTPGPWAIYPDSPDTSVYCDDELGSRVADCDPGFPTILPMAQRKANAKLVAAAPDMLTVFQKLSKVYRTGYGEDLLQFSTDIHPILTEADNLFFKLTGE